MSYCCHPDVGMDVGVDAVLSAGFIVLHFFNVVGKALLGELFCPG